MYVEICTITTMPEQSNNNVFGMIFNLVGEYVR